METIRGIAVFPGVAIGAALVLDQEGCPAPVQTVDAGAVGAEVERLQRCLTQVADEIQQNARTVSERLGSEAALIFEAHRRIILDPHLGRQFVARIEGQRYSAETAVRSVLDEYVEFFRTLKNSHFADRASDIRDIERRILTQLTGDRCSTLQSLQREVIVVAHDLTPSETAGLDPRYVRGLATETGGRTSHTAIVAGALEIPAIVGLGHCLDRLVPGATIIVDGHHGLLILDPDPATLERYLSSAREFIQFEQSLVSLRDLPAETLDGVRIQLLGNIEFPHECEHCLQRGADGIGLYRTEFLYLDRDRPPTEEEHYEAYANVMRAMGEQRPVVFRTMDLGADKLNHREEHDVEQNPVLGLRSVRLSLRRLPVFKTQMRAMLRASVLGNLRIMFPLVTTLKELRRCRMVLADVMEDLEEEEIPFRRDIQVGMMVEVPSAALMADQFSRHVDFFSIGTNDLIQYTLAVDRTNERVASLYSASDPAVLKLLQLVVTAAQRNGIAVNVCGEMSGDPIYTLLLLGMGLRQFSVTPHNIPEIKKVIRSATIADAVAVARRVRRLDLAGDVTNFLRSRVRPLVPELVDEPA